MTWRTFLQFLFGWLAPGGVTYALLDRAFGFYIPWRKDAIDSAAGDATAVSVIGRVEDAGEVLEVEYIPDAALTAHDTNYATINLLKGDGTAEPATVVATQTTKITGGSGNWVDGSPVTLPLTVANVSLAAGSVLAVSIAKANAGVQVPAGLLNVRVAPR